LRHLFATTDLEPLVFFRIFFGAMMLYWVIATVNDLWVDFFYVRPIFHLTYPGFSWVRPWPGQGMYYHFGVMALAAIGITTGCFYRVNAAVFSLCFTYVFLLEKGLYQNHYYLICLISGIMVFIPANRMWSIDAYWRPKIRSRTCPKLCLWILQLQLAIPYFYGGISKINSDWLHGMPVRIWLERRNDMSGAGPWMTTDFAVYFVAWGVLIFDLLIVPALLWRRTRLLAYLAALVFHISNHFLWDIGVFPWFMIGATLLFFPAEEIGRYVFRQTDRRPGPSVAPVQLNRKQQLTVTLVGLYTTWQVLFPFRHFLYPGDVSWTEEAHHFSWHMMLREKDVGIRFFVHNKTTGARGLIKLSDFLLERQLSRMAKDPDMILEFAHFFRDHYQEHGQGHVEIRILALASLNGRRPQLLIDPNINYAVVDRVWGPQPWVIPLYEPLRRDAWNLPLDQWDAEFADLIPADMKIWGKQSQRDPDR